jgi:hypothetical protein
MMTSSLGVVATVTFAPASKCRHVSLSDVSKLWWIFLTVAILTPFRESILVKLSIKLVFPLFLPRLTMQITSDIHHHFDRTTIDETNIKITHYLPFFMLVIILKNGMKATVE